MRRTSIAIATFLATTLFVFCTATGAAFGLLEYLDDFRGSMGLAFAVVIYSPVLVIFLVAAVVAGLWTSYRVYFGKRNRHILN